MARRPKRNYEASGVDTDQCNQFPETSQNCQEILKNPKKTMAESLNRKIPISLVFGKFDSHSSGKSEIHKFSVMAMQNFLAAMGRQTAPIDQQLNRLMQAQMVENREKMKSIPLASSGIRPSISSLMEKLILVETSHKNCWIHP